MSIKSEIVKIFEVAAREAGDLIRKEFGKISEAKIQSKDLGDFVTTTDLETENILLKVLKKHFTKSSYITEESDPFKGNDETIVIDPIDRTTNFIHGIPAVGIVIGRIYNSEITDGIIFNPISDEFYFISPDKCTECKGFHEEPQCAAVCPVDCCVPDDNHVESDEVLLSKQKFMHPDN